MLARAQLHRLASWLVLLCATLCAADTLAVEPRNILVLFGNGRLVQANAEIERALRKAVPDTVDRPVRVFSEFLDGPEFVGDAYESSLMSFLRDKYARHAPDVVVAVTKESLDFMLRHRAQLFPGVPVVHAATFGSYLRATPPLPADVVGVAVEYDAAGTIEQALRWHPNARQLLIVTGKSKRDLDWDAQLRELVPRFEGRVKVEFLAGQPTASVLKRLSELDDSTVVFTAGYYHGADNIRMTPRESVVAMAQASAAPVYGPLSTFVGTGAVGGRVPSFEAIGRQAGEIASALLNGTAPAALRLPAVMPVELTIDWRQAQRWGINDAQIPADANVLFRAPTFWQAYRNVALAVTAAILLQAVLIAALLLERRRRRKSELTVQGQRSELAHASRLAVAGELTASIAHEINQPLGAILASADAAEMLLESGVDRREDLLRIVTRIRRDDLRASEVIQRLRSLLAKHKPKQQPINLNVALSDVSAILGGLARRRQVTLDFRPATAAAVVQGDAVQIQQVLINLIINAMDAVDGLPEERRRIVVAVDKRGTKFGVTVRDRGHGIAPERLPMVFESFFSTKQQGMGLGLSIARTIVEAHGGHIRAENGHGEGAVFHIELPAQHNSDEYPATAI
jgi:signal transduction histidine kinase